MAARETIRRIRCVYLITEFKNPNHSVDNNTTGTRRVCGVNAAEGGDVWKMDVVLGEGFAARRDLN